MDVCESEQALRKQSTPERRRRPLLPAENKNGASRLPQTREVSSRYRSPTPSSTTAPKRSPSPSATRKLSIPTVSAPKRATSAERTRPFRPSSPPSPSTPVQDTAAENLSASKKMANNRLPESLWPSTMRSLSVSFQSDTYSIPISKREKTVSHDRSLRPSSNVAAHRQAENNPASRKPTPERKRSPLKGKNSADQSENFKPVDSLHPHLVDQHRWPSRTSGKAPNALNRSVNLADNKGSKTPSLSRSGSGTPFIRRLSLDGPSKPLLKSSSDLLTQISRDESGKAQVNGCSVEDSSLLMRRPSSSSSSDRTLLASAAARALSNPTPLSRPPSPSVSRGVSPSRARVVNPSSRGPSPARVRPSSPSRQPQAQTSTSVLSFIADIKKGKKVANHIEDVHQLRLLYNRHLQWRYANARTAAVLQSQKVKAEKILYSVWMTIADLWDSLMEKRVDLQQLRLKLKLYSVLNNQLTCLHEWASMETNHVNSLTWTIQDLQASTLRIPVTGGARADIETVKAALCSAVDVVKAMGSSLFSILSKVEGINGLVSELADVAAKERAMLDECDSVLGSTAALQVEENSLRTHLLQMKQAWRNVGMVNIHGPSDNPRVFAYDMLTT